MDKISGTCVQENRETIIEESKLTLNFKNFSDHVGNIVSAKIKLKSIAAEWWIVVGSKTFIPYCSIPYADNTFAGQHRVPINFYLTQKPNQIQNLQNCKFSIAVTAKGHPMITTSYEASNLPTWSPPESKYHIDEKKKDLVLDVVFTIKRVEITMISSESEHLVDASQEILDNFSKMLKDPTFSDFTFNVKGKEFKVHKTVLAAASPVFTRLFLSDLKESRKNFCTIKHIEPGVFEVLLGFIYGAKLPVNLKDRAKDLYKAAHYYEVERLKKICETEVHFQLSVKNALDLYIMAHTYDMKELKKDAWDIVKRNVFKINYRIKGEPLSPKDLQNVIAGRESEQKFFENLKEYDTQQPPLKQMKLG